MSKRAGAGPGAPEDAGDTPGDGFGRTSTRSTLILYAGLILGALAVLQVVLHLGAGLHAPHAARSSTSTAAGGPDQILWRLFFAIAVVIIVSRAAGSLFRRIGQPQVVGEIVAGIVLGPSVLGAAWPSATHLLFSNAVLPYLDVLAQIGLILFMFLIGLELDVRLIRGRGHAAATVSHVSILAPFLLGAGLALILFPSLGSASGRFVPFALFMGASMSITAFPVLARILTERGINRTRLGTVALTCAAVDDVTAWCILAVVVAVARAHGVGPAVVTIALSVAFILAMILLVRPLLARLASYHEAQGQLSGAVLAGVFVGILVSALITDRIGIHAIFGAFLFGAIMPQRSELIRELAGKLEDFVAIFLLPLFFAYTGLRTQVGLIGGSAKLWGYLSLILLVAVVGKLGGSALASRAVGLGWREAAAVGVLMNTRGLTELIILNIGLDLGVIPPALFAMLVIMALVTTFMTTPFLSLAFPRRRLEAMIREESGDDEGAGTERYRILVHLARTDATAHTLVHTAIRLAREHEEQASVILLRVVRLPGSAYRQGPLAQEAVVRRATEALKPLVALVEGAGCEAVPVVVPSSDVADTILRVASTRDPDIILLARQQSAFGRRLLGGTIGEVFRRAAADVAVLIDPSSRGVGLPSGSRILVPYGGGFHEAVGLDLALRLAEASGASVTLAGQTDGDAGHDLAERAARAYEETGVWTTVAPATDFPGDLVAQAGGADLVVLGMSDRWVHDQESLGTFREALAARTSAPLLIVRRHGQPGQRRGPSRWLRRQREWMEEAADEATREGRVVA